MSKIFNKQLYILIATITVVAFVSIMVSIKVFKELSTTEYVMVGASMSPTLEEGDTFEGRSVSPSKVERGDIIIFNNPVKDRNRLAKRVIGLPGDTVVIKDEKITVIQPNKEEYALLDNSSLNTEDKLVEVEKNSFYVAGDNRSVGSSLDSRNRLGLVPFDSLLGLVEEP